MGRIPCWGMFQGASEVNLLHCWLSVDQHTAAATCAPPPEGKSWRGGGGEREKMGKDGQCLWTFAFGAFTRDLLHCRLLVNTQPLAHAHHGKMASWHSGFMTSCAPCLRCREEGGGRKRGVEGEGKEGTSDRKGRSRTPFASVIHSCSTWLLIRPHSIS